MKKNLGFTLIELLVVISIISLLSSIVLSSVQDARNKAKATALLEITKSFQTALELYRVDNGHYPNELDDVMMSWKYSNGGGDSVFSNAFENFDRYMDLEAAFNPDKFPNDVLVQYFPYGPHDFEEYSNFVILCEDEVNIPGKSLEQDIYHIVFQYKNSDSIANGVFGKFPKVMAWYLSSEDYEYMDDDGMNYFSDTATCITN